MKERKQAVKNVQIKSTQEHCYKHSKMGYLLPKLQ